ncbi:MAG: orotidine-5'-phosphate decarboxylase [Planctomycetes bacterium]|nr:orotidine-5'-phosphate decarboxylase [Planctomycetota bacterium]
MTPSDHFADRLFEAVRRTGSALCVGIDPVWERIPAGLREAEGGDPARAFLAFARGVVDAVAGVVPAVKPNVAFFEAAGAEGYAAYLETVRHARSAGLVVIADVKRGDIDSTAEAYARAHLEVAGADAVTVNPYLGGDGVRPFVEVAAASGRGVFVLVRTTNPSAREFQEADAGGVPLWRRVAERVAAWGEPHRGRSGYSLVGAVVGATSGTALGGARCLLPAAPLLVPGYGAQGGSARDLTPCFDGQGLGALVNASRSVIYAGEGEDWVEGVRSAARRAGRDIDSVRGRGAHA